MSLALRQSPSLVGWGSRFFPRLRSATCSCLAIYFLLLSAALQAQDLQLAANTLRSTDGYFVLSWDGGGSDSSASPRFLLEEAGEESFSTARTIYHGADKSRVISGKPDGEYFYRVRLAGDGNPTYGPVVRVEVAHHSLQRALSFFVLGLIVFVATLSVVLRGSRSRSGEADS